MKNKKNTALLLAMVMVISCAFTGFAFTDVAEDDKYTAAIRELAEMGIVKGYNEATFGANDVCTREQFITFLYRASGSPAVAEKAAFTDVDNNAYYADAIAWGNANGIIKGFEDGTIGIGKAVDREHAAYFLFNWGVMQNKADLKNGVVLNEYTDAAEIGLYARHAFAWAMRKRLFEAQDNKLLPKENVTRGWVAYAVRTVLTTHVCNWQDWKDNGDGTCTRICAIDNGHSEEGPHNYNDGELTKAVTATEDGEITYTCKNCLNKKVEKVPAGTEIVTRADLETAIANGAWAYYVKNPYMQYDSSSVTYLHRYAGGTSRASAEMPPEFATEDMNFYSVCSDYAYQTYFETLNTRLMGERNAAFGLSCQELHFSGENQLERKFSLVSVNEPWTENDVDCVVAKWIDYDYYLEKSKISKVSQFVAFNYFDSTHFTDYTEGLYFKEDGFDGELHYSYYDAEGNRLDPEKVEDDYFYAFTDNYKENLRPGDLQVSNSHTTLYVGGNLTLHCSYPTGGGKIGADGDKLEPDGAIFADFNCPRDKFGASRKQALIVMRPLNLIVAPGYDEDWGNDIAMDIEIPEDTKTREQYPAMSIERTVDITHYGTAVAGENLTYTVKIFNKTNNENYIKWGADFDHGKKEPVAYKGLVVTETVPEGTQLVAESVTAGGVVEGNKITWNLSDIAPGEMAEVSYSVKVTAPVGTVIENGGGFVGNIPSNVIKNTVGGKKLADNEKTSLSSIAAGGVEGLKELGTDTDFAEAIYKKMGEEIELPSTLDLAMNLFTPETFIPGEGYTLEGGIYAGLYKEYTTYTRRYETSEEYRPYLGMLVDRLYGGRSFYAGHDKKWEYATKTVLDFRPEHLEEGDIVIYFKAKGQTMEDMSGDLEKISIMVYDGENLLVSNKAEETTYEIIGKDDTYKRLTQLISWDDAQLFFVLRPSQLDK